mgnify:CR=1 FL=1
MFEVRTRGAGPCGMCELRRLWTSYLFSDRELQGLFVVRNIGLVRAEPYFLRPDGFCYQSTVVEEFTREHAVLEAGR